MELLGLLSLLVRSLSVITRDPDLGVRGESIGKVLDLAAVAIERGDAGAEGLRELVERVKEMADAQRAPTIEEWSALRARSDAAHAVLAAVPDQPAIEENDQ